MGATLKCALHKYLQNYTLCRKPLVMTIVDRTEKKTCVPVLRGTVTPGLCQGIAGEELSPKLGWEVRKVFMEVEFDFLVEF